MKISLTNPDTQYYIRHYQDHTFKINNDLYQESIIVHPDQAPLSWPGEHTSEITDTHIDYLISNLAKQTQILLIGTGEQHIFPDQSILAPLYALGISVEIMSSSAACKTFNLLASEGRCVAAALIA